jgi:SAM-dependent methyltransferase
MWKLLGKTHEKAVFGRRVKRLAATLAPALPRRARVLDIGCGDGLIDKLIQEQRPDLRIEGIDVLLRPRRHIPVKKFDGTHIPFEDGEFDYGLFIDVLHHTDDPVALMGEALRVCKSGLVIKDHAVEGLLARPTLRFMDWVGNAPHGVVLPYNYLTLEQWRRAFDQLGLSVASWQDAIGLYPAPFGLIFDRKLHFVSRLESDRCPTVSEPSHRARSAAAI